MPVPTWAAPWGIGAAPPTAAGGDRRAVWSSAARWRSPMPRCTSVAVSRCWRSRSRWRPVRSCNRPTCARCGCSTGNGLPVLLASRRGERAGSAGVGPSGGRCAADAERNRCHGTGGVGIRRGGHRAQGGAVPAGSGSRGPSTGRSRWSSSSSSPESVRGRLGERRVTRRSARVSATVLAVDVAAADSDNPTVFSLQVSTTSADKVAALAAANEASLIQVGSGSG